MYGLEQGASALTFIFGIIFSIILIFIWINSAKDGRSNKDITELGLGGILFIIIAIIVLIIYFS
jgi:hypothetical protein